MSDDILKNPNRKTLQTKKTSNYVPEWVRLNKEPIVNDGKSNDAAFFNNKKITQVKSHDLEPLVNANSSSSTVSKIPTSVKSTSTEIVLNKQTNNENKFPQQMKVSVGQSKNWSDELSEEEKRISSEKILYDEVPVPQNSSDDDSDYDDYDEENEENDEAQAGILQPGEYGVIVKGVVVLQTPLLSEAESMIERILFDQLPEFSQVVVDDIILIKRFQLKVGILAVLE